MMAANNGVMKAATKKGGRVGAIVDQPGEQSVTITPPNFRVGVFKIKGTAPLVAQSWSAKKRNEMRAKQVAGAAAGSRKKREPRNFEGEFEASMHFSEEGWVGHPASAFRSAMIRAGSNAGFKMTVARMSLFVEADGIDRNDGTPLVRIDGKPEHLESVLPNANGSADIRVRAMFRQWGMTLRVKYDADLFCLEDVANLLARAGVQVGVGEGRPFSREGNGCGWGTFEVVS